MFHRIQNLVCNLITSGERQADIDKKQKALAEELRAKLGGNSGVATDTIKVTSINRKDESPECELSANKSSSEEKVEDVYKIYLACVCHFKVHDLRYNKMSNKLMP